VGLGAHDRADGRRAILIAALVGIERRSAAPLMRLSIFRVRTLAVADSVLLLVASGLFGMFFFASLYVQDILGYSPLRAGLAFLPVTGGIVVGAGIAQQLIRRLGVRNVAVGGIAIATAGMAVLTQLPGHGSYAGDLLTGLLPMSIGMGLTFVPITLLGTGGVTGDDAGLASGLFNTAQQVGGSLGLAILSTLAAKSDGQNAAWTRWPGERSHAGGARVRLPRGVRGRSDHAGRRRCDPRRGPPAAPSAALGSGPDALIGGSVGECKRDVGS
jgi:predicted MFS family arabinose efflux permease